MIVTGAVGVVIERVFYRRLTRGGGGYTVAGMGMIICGFGMSVALQNVAYLIWGAAPHPYPVSFGMPIFLGNIALPKSYLYILVSALVLMAVLHTFLTRTKLGLAVRAVAYNKDTSYLMGVNVPAMISLIFGVACAMAAVAGVLIGPINYVQIEMGYLMLLKAFAAAVVGGFGSLPGALLGGVVGGTLRDPVRGLPDRQLQGHLCLPAADYGIDGKTDRPARYHREGEGIVADGKNILRRRGAPAAWPGLRITGGAGTLRRRHYPNERRNDMNAVRKKEWLCPRNVVAGLAAGAMLAVAGAASAGVIKIGASLRMKTETGEKYGQMVVDELSAINAAGGVNGHTIEIKLAQRRVQVRHRRGERHQVRLPGQRASLRRLDVQLGVAADRGRHPQGRGADADPPFHQLQDHPEGQPLGVPGADLVAFLGRRGREVHGREHRHEDRLHLGLRRRLAGRCAEVLRVHPEFPRRGAALRGAVPGG